MNDYEGTRNFETVQSEEPKAPKSEKPDPKKKISIAIFATVIAIVLLFCAVIITEIVYQTNGRKNDPTADINYVEIVKTSSDINKGSLLVIDSAGDVEFSPSVVSIRPSTDGNPYYIGTSSLPKDKLTSDAGDALKEMAKALYEAKSVKFVVAYAYHASPSAAYDAEHALGTVVDLKQVTNESENAYGKFDSEILSWLNKNCAKYGFINSFPNDTDSSFVHDEGTSQRSIQFRYVGVAHATYMTNNGLTFEEYISKIETYSHEKPLSIKGADGNNYSVYFVESEGDRTHVNVPENYEYEISGNNKNGFIVTVDLSKEAE